MYLFLFVLDLHCCVGYSLVVVCGLLIAEASAVGGPRGHRLHWLQFADSRAQAQKLWITGLVAPWRGM